MQTARYISRSVGRSVVGLIDFIQNPKPDSSDGLTHQLHACSSEYSVFASMRLEAHRHRIRMRWRRYPPHRHEARRVLPPKQILDGAATITISFCAFSKAVQNPTTTGLAGCDSSQMIYGLVLRSFLNHETSPPKKYN